MNGIPHGFVASRKPCQNGTRFAHPYNVSSKCPSPPTFSIVIWRFCIIFLQRKILSLRYEAKPPPIHVCKWSPIVNAVDVKCDASNCWIGLSGLPLHLWILDVLFVIGETCGGVIKIFQATKIFSNLTKERVLVRTSCPANIPKVIHIRERGGHHYLWVLVLDELGLNRATCWPIYSPLTASYRFQSPNLLETMRG